MGARGHRDLVDSETSCPVCGNLYDRGTPLLVINNHIDRCLQDTKQHEPQRADTTPAPQTDFVEKNRWLRNRLNAVKVPWQTDCAVLQFERERLSEDSWMQLAVLNSEGLRKEFQILFDGEIASDAGGVLKEWISKLNSELLAQDFGLFRLTSTELVSYRFHPLLKASHLHMAQLYGLLLGKALLEGVPVHSPLCKPLFKALLRASLGLEDLKFLDIHLYKSLKFMLENDITDLIFETFCVTEVSFEFQESQITDLVPSGRSIPVTETNKSKYVELRVDWELRKSAEAAISGLLIGFYTVIPEELLRSFMPEELELAICGLSFIDVTDWEANTEYRGDYHARHKVILWFWQILQDLPQPQLVKLLQFVTGTTRLPVEGFRMLKTLRGDPAKFTIEAVPYTLQSVYPRAHTCFNRLDLPQFPSPSELQSRLLYVILNHSEGFGIE